MTDKKIIPEHDQIRIMKEVAHYPDHEQRTEDPEFRKTKKELKADKEHWKCFIDNKHCTYDEPLEVHHNIVEFAAANEVDWDRVKQDFPLVDGISDRDQMRILCRLHHRSPGYGIHEMSYPIWQLQRYMTDEALDKFAAAVETMLKEEQ
jgi:hypothetical protein